MSSLEILSKKTHHRVPVSCISYVERQAQKIIVHTDNEDFICYRKTMDEFEEQLAPRGFLRINQSQLISAARVVAFSKTFLSISGRFFPISQKRQSYCFQYLEARHKGGMLTCYGGPYSRSHIYIMPERTVVIGQDSASADLVINMYRISPNHLSICYHPKNKTYTLIDLSTSGTFVDGDQLTANTPYTFQPGRMVCLGRASALYELCVAPEKKKQ